MGMEDIHLHIAELKDLHASPTEILTSFIRPLHPRDKNLFTETSCEREKNA
jgi:hypothetical protein